MGPREVCQGGLPFGILRAQAGHNELDGFYQSNQALTVNRLMMGNPISSLIDHLQMISDVGPLNGAVREQPFQPTLPQGVFVVR